MISRFFHGWERRLASISTNRVARPFEWGVEWLADQRLPAGDPRRVLQDWGEAAVANSGDFYAVSPASDAVLEGDTLTFTRARSRRRIQRTTRFGRATSPTLSPRGERAVLVMAQWEFRRGRSRRAVPAAQSLRHLGLPPQSSLSRRPHAARAHARRLHRQRERRPDGAGVPPGRPRRAARHRLAGRARLRVDRDPRHQPRVVPGDADHGARAADQGGGAEITSRRSSPTSCGTGSTMHVRETLEGNVTLDELRRMWLPISPLPRACAAADPARLRALRPDVPVDLSRMLVSARSATRASSTSCWSLPCGHYSTGVTPFKWMDGLTLCRFLNRALPVTGI